MQEWPCCTNPKGSFGLGSVIFLNLGDEKLVFMAAFRNYGFIFVNKKILNRDSTFCNAKALTEVPLTVIE